MNAQSCYWKRFMDWHLQFTLQAEKLSIHILALLIGLQFIKGSQDDRSWWFMVAFIYSLISWTSRILNARFELSRDIEHLDNTEHFADFIIDYLLNLFNELDIVGLGNLYWSLSTKTDSNKIGRWYETKYIWKFKSIVI